MQHQKHSKIAKPEYGRFGRREWAIMGASCGSIQQLAREVAALLRPGFQVGYVDADHKSADAGEAPPAFDLEYTDKIGFHRFDTAAAPDDWQQHTRFNAADLVLVNGNHFAAARQIVALDRRKFDSLQRKLDRLTQVDLFLTRTGDPNFAQPAELPETLKQKLPAWAILPVLDMQDSEGLSTFLKARLTPPPLKALVLTGGKSQRMGQDKSALDYHGRPHWQHLGALLQSAGIHDVFFSCRAEQAAAFSPDPVITDTFLDLGPMGAILSAFRHDPGSAWLVLACDLPLLDEATIRFLLDHRRPSAIATAFRQPPPPPGWATSKAPQDAGFPEPLITIWEPKSYLTLLQFLAQGVSCPRKVLINSPVHLLDAPDPDALLNVNTPEEREQVLGRIMR